MKIQELFESTTNIKTELVINIILKNSNSNQITFIRNQLLHHVLKKYNLKFIVDNYSSNWLQIYCSITEDLSSNASDLEKLFNQIMNEELSKFLDPRVKKDEESNYFIRSINGINMKVNSPLVLLDFKTTANGTLENIHNFIGKNVETLQISGIENIKSNVLGLLKLQCRITASTLKTPKWFNIVNEYIKGNKDVWKCQDELQDNNLDEYADL